MAEFITNGRNDHRAVEIWVVAGEEFCQDLLEQFADQTIDEYGWFALVSESKGDDGNLLGAVVQEWDEDEGAKIGEPMLVNNESVRLGLRLIAGGHVAVNNRIRNTILTALVTDDSGHIDSEASDALFQAICFGEIRYS